MNVNDRYAMEQNGVILNEALCFLSNKYDLKTVLMSFYRDDELVAAKEVLAKSVQVYNNVFK